jgi:sterol desaturase/sphingolipid hydroxylase (fatty acid hydroxylase superfamily)
MAAPVADSVVAPAETPAAMKVERSNEPDHPSLKQSFFNLVPPMMVVGAVSFWGWGPEAWVGHPWALVIATSCTVLLVLGLEFVNERHAGWRLNRREFFTDLFYVVLSGTLISWLSRNLADDPLLALKQSLGVTTEWALHLPFVAQVALFVLVFEFGQYWMHRLMHNQAFLWSTHAPHHHITQLNAAKGYVGNPLELFLISLSMIALFDLPERAIFGGVNVLAVISTFAHANVRSDPPQFYSFFFTTIRHHSLHHTALSYEDTRCNYGNSLILLDRIFGTYREGESAIVGQDDRRRLSIREQWLFPIRPLIERCTSKSAGPAPASN